MLNADLQEKLRRLRVTKGARSLRPALPVLPPVAPVAPAVRAADLPDDDDPLPVERLLPGGRRVTTAYGDCFLHERVYSLHHQHGDRTLRTVLEAPPAALTDYLGASLPASPADCLFIDTETTGLAGAGTIAFMVGVGFFDGAAFVVRQYFARDFDEEAALLSDLAALAGRFRALVSFNGRSFDIPLLQTRYLLNRLEPPFDAHAHIDLLLPARRIWRRRLGSVALGALEAQLLNVRRARDDVPGYLIPALYHDYLRSGDARPLAGVFYHNEVDVLSMVALLGRLVDLVLAPDLCREAHDLFSLACWQVDLNLPTAEAYLRQAASIDCDVATWQQILLATAQLLKRQQRRADALPLWLQVAHTTIDDISAHIELAKYYEWHAANGVGEALRWTERALTLLPTHGDPAVRAALAHRHGRLTRKLAGYDDQN